MRTIRFLPLLLLAASAGLPAPAGAQEPQVYVRRAAPRARIGVMLASKPDADTDRLGARIERVLPGSPAAAAGLEEGDIITKFNGSSLAGAAGEGGESGPAGRLVEMVRGLEPGDTARVEYRRGDATRTATVVADERPWADVADIRGMEMLPRRMMELERMPRDFHFTFGGPGGLELAELNPGLGEYFGVSEGVLVLETPRDSTLGLKAGDVIRSIDGRKPQDAAHARRILASYAEGETVKLEVTRQRRSTTVSWKVPEEMGMGLHRKMPTRVRAPRAERT